MYHYVDLEGDYFDEEEEEPQGRYRQQNEKRVMALASQSGDEDMGDDSSSAEPYQFDGAVRLNRIGSIGGRGSEKRGLT